jgi:hypothetical protein
LVALLVLVLLSASATLVADRSISWTLDRGLVRDSGDVALGDTAAVDVTTDDAACVSLLADAATDDGSGDDEA